MKKRLIVVVFGLVAFLSSCTPAQLAGLQTADMAMRGACGAILATANPPPAETLAALQAIERQLVALAAAQAAKNASPDVVNALQAGIATNAGVLRALTEQLLRLAALSSPSALPTGTLAPAPSVPPSTTPAALAPAASPPSP